MMTSSSHDDNHLQQSAKPQSDTNLIASMQDSDSPSLPHKDTRVPSVIIYLLVMGNLLIGLMPLRQGTSWTSWVLVIEQWALLFLVIPLGVVLMALPLKWRDPTIKLKLVYLMGLFGAFVYSINKLRYLR